MRKLIMGCALAAGLAISGCGTIPGGGPGGVASASQLDEKALGLAVTAAHAADLAAEIAVDAGVLKGPNAAKVADVLEQAHSAIAVANAAYAMGDAATVMLKMASAKSLIDQAMSLIPHH